MDPDRVLDELRELAALTSDAGGAQRLAWGPGWRTARDWLSGKLAELPCEVEVDAAGNLHATIRGDGPGLVAVGSHLDSVPGGGWLDGALGVVAGLEVLRTHARGPVGVRLFDWADEEGARFGVSLFGSSAAAGTLDVAHVPDLPAVLREHGLDLGTATQARRSLDDVRCFLELHIEQGPVLDRARRPVAVVTGTAGVERHLVRFTGVAAHAGAAPMEGRRDPVMAAARFVLAARAVAVQHGATATAGRLAVEPGVPTIVPAAGEVVIDHRSPDAATLATVLAGSRAAAAGAARDEGVTVAWAPQWRIAPVPFDRGLVALAQDACREAGAEPMVLASGALHDAASLAPLVPTVMLFSSTRDGISHSREEDADPDDLAVAIRAFGALAARAQAWAARRPR